MPGSNHIFLKITMLLIAASLLVSSSSAQHIIDITEEPLTLNQAIITALKNNPDVVSMLRAVGRSEYLYRAASKEWMPAFSLDYLFTGFPRIPEVTLEGVDDSGGSDQFPLTDSTSFIFGAHVKMPIYTSGAVEHRTDMAKFGIDVSKMRFFEARADLIQEVTINYHNILRFQNYSKVVMENLKRFIEHEENTKHNFEVGLIAKNALLEVRAKRANVQQDLIEVEKDLKVAKAALNVAMGIGIDTRFILEEVTQCREIAYSVEECFDLACENNPSLAVFTYLSKIAKTDVKLQQTDLWPQVYGDVSYYRHGKTPALRGDDYFTNDIVMAMVKADWKVFDWFRTMDLAKAKKEEVEILVEKLRSVEDRVALDIRESHLAMKAAKNKFSVAERGIEYADENYRISQLRYDEKVAKSTEVNDALVLLRSSQFNYYTAFYQYSIAVAKLERVIGASGYPYEDQI